MTFKRVVSKCSFNIASSSKRRVDDNAQWLCDNFRVSAEKCMAIPLITSLRVLFVEDVEIHTAANRLVWVRIRNLMHNRHGRRCNKGRSGVLIPRDSNRQAKCAQDFVGRSRDSWEARGVGVDVAGDEGKKHVSLKEGFS